MYPCKPQCHHSVGYTLITCYLQKVTPPPWAKCATRVAAEACLSYKQCAVCRPTNKTQELCIAWWACIAETPKKSSRHSQKIGSGAQAQKTCGTAGFQRFATTPTKYAQTSLRKRFSWQYCVNLLNYNTGFSTACRDSARRAIMHSKASHGRCTDNNRTETGVV